MATGAQQLTFNDQKGSIFQALHRPAKLNSEIERVTNDLLGVKYNDFIAKRKAKHAAAGHEYVEPSPADRRAEIERIRSKVRFNDVIKEISKDYNVPIHQQYKPSMATAAEYVRTPVGAGSMKFGSSVTFKLPTDGDFITDCAVKVTVGAISSITDGDKVRWAKNLGHRMFPLITFKSNGDKVDDYNTEDMNHHLDLQVKAEDKNAYLRSIGQEIPHEGTVVADPTNDNYRESILILDGNQTYKGTHDEFTIIMPLWFWFNEMGMALPNCGLKNNSCTIEMKIAKLVDLVSFADNVGDGSFTTPTITNMELISNHITTTDAITKVYQKHAGMQLISVHQSQVVNVGANEGTQTISLDAKHACECVIVSARPTINLENTQTWNRNAVITTNSRPHPVANIPPGGGAAVSQYVDAQWYTDKSSLDNISLTINGNSVFNNQSSALFGDYMTLNRNEINSSEFGDLYLMPFSREPFSKNPNGTLDLGKILEVNLIIVPSQAAKNLDMLVYIHTRALALIIIKDGKIVKQEM